MYHDFILFFREINMRFKTTTYEKQNSNSAQPMCTFFLENLLYVKISGVIARKISIIHDILWYGADIVSIH